MAQVSKKKIGYSSDQIVPAEWSSEREKKQMYFKDLRPFKTAARKRFKVDHSVKRPTPKNVKRNVFLDSFVNQFVQDRNSNKSPEIAVHISPTSSPPSVLCRTSAKHSNSLPRTGNKDWIYDSPTLENPDISLSPSPIHCNSHQIKSKQIQNSNSISLSKRNATSERKSIRKERCVRELFQDITFAISPNKNSDQEERHLTISPCHSPYKHLPIKPDTFGISTQQSPKRYLKNPAEKKDIPLCRIDAFSSQTPNRQTIATRDYKIDDALSPPKCESRLNKRVCHVPQQDNPPVESPKSNCPSKNLKSTLDTFDPFPSHNENTLSKAEFQIDELLSPTKTESRGTKWLTRLNWENNTNVDSPVSMNFQAVHVKATQDVAIVEQSSPVKAESGRGTGWLDGICWQNKTPLKSPAKCNPPDSNKKRKYYVTGGLAQQLRKLEMRERASFNLERHKASSKSKVAHQLLVTATDLSVDALPLAYCQDISSNERLIIVIPRQQVTNMAAGTTLKVSKLGQRTVVSSGVTVIFDPADLQVVNTDKCNKSSRLLFKWQCSCQCCKDVNVNLYPT